LTKLLTITLCDVCASGIVLDDGLLTVHMHSVTAPYIWCFCIIGGSPRLRLVLSMHGYIHHYLLQNYRYIQ